VTNRIEIFTRRKLKGKTYGGAAKNSCLCQLISKAFGMKIHVPEAPHFVGAYGAALLARDTL